MNSHLGNYKIYYQQNIEYTTNLLIIGVFSLKTDVQKMQIIRINITTTVMTMFATKPKCSYITIEYISNAFVFK